MWIRARSTCSTRARSPSTSRVSTRSCSATRPRAACSSPRTSAWPWRTARCSSSRWARRLMTDYKLVIDKSTVPVGTADKVRAAIQAELVARGVTLDFSVASNPEFLKEGAAVDDFMKPDRIVVGAEDDRAINLLRAVYAPFQRNREKLVVMDVRSAELTKYAANAMLATRISFKNELALLAEAMGADIEP